MELNELEMYVRKYLIKRASQKANFTYSELCNEACLEFDMSVPADRGRLGHLLGNISRYEVANGRPMLSAIVVDKNDRMQGGGFFDLAVELGLLHDGADIEAFSVAENVKTKDYWSKHTDK